MRVDTHVHLLPDDYRRVLRERELVPCELPPWSEEMTDAFMDRHAIDAAVLSLAPPGVHFGDRGLSRELARMVNEATAGQVARDASRFAGMAVVPLDDPDAAITEIAHAFDVLGLDGVTLPTNLDGAYPGARSWAPVLDELNRRGAYVLLHPTMPVGGPVLPDHPIWLYEFPFDTTRAVVDLVYSGALERCSNLRVQVSHLGGTVPFLAQRLASLEAREPERAAAAPRGMLAHLRELFYDTGLSNHLGPVQATAAVAGPGRIVFGTDWPYAVLPEEGDPAPELDALGPAARAGLDAGHAAALVPRLLSSTTEATP